MVSGFSALVDFDTAVPPDQPDVSYLSDRPVWVYC